MALADGGDAAPGGAVMRREVTPYVGGGPAPVATAPQQMAARVMASRAAQLAAEKEAAEAAEAEKSFWAHAGDIAYSALDDTVEPLRMATDLGRAAWFGIKSLFGATPDTEPEWRSNFAKGLPKPGNDEAVEKYSESSPVSEVLRVGWRFPGTRFLVEGYCQTTRYLDAEGTARKRTEVMAWVLSLCCDLRLSQAKTLSELVAATLGVGRMSLSAIGRCLPGETTAKSRIQRVWRFTSNRRVLVSDAMRGVIRCLLRGPRKKPLLVAFDWTEIRNFHTLMAAAVMKGRAVPLVWASYPEWVLHKSQNNLEEGLLRLLKDMLPKDLPVTLLADRGFGRTELARTCQLLGFHYVVRVKADVWVASREFHGKLLDYPVKKGVCRLLKNVAFRKERPVQQHVVVRWKPGLPRRRDEPWFLMTDLEQSPKKLSEMYGKRMTIEELFRDDKNKRNGWALRHTKITQADRLDRLLLILALAYVLLVGLGLMAQERFRPGMWCSSNDPRQCSVFTIGRVMLLRMEVKLAAAVAAVAMAIAEAARNWG